MGSAGGGSRRHATAVRRPRSSCAPSVAGHRAPQPGSSCPATGLFRPRNRALHAPQPGSSCPATGLFLLCKFASPVRRACRSAERFVPGNPGFDVGRRLASRLWPEHLEEPATTTDNTVRAACVAGKGAQSVAGAAAVAARIKASTATALAKGLEQVARHRPKEVHVLRG